MNQRPPQLDFLGFLPSQMTKNGMVQPFVYVKYDVCQNVQAQSTTDTGYLVVLLCEQVNRQGENRQLSSFLLAKHHQLRQN